MAFKPGDRLKSKRSGRVFVYALENPPRPEGESPNTIPVRDELWAPAAVVWFREDNFELVDEDYYDTTRDEDQNKL